MAWSKKIRNQPHHIRLHLLFQGISHHFLGQNPLVQKWLRLCFEVEDLLLESGELKSDFMFLVCKHRPVNS